MLAYGAQSRPIQPNADNSINGNGSPVIDALVLCMCPCASKWCDRLCECECGSIMFCECACYTCVRVCVYVCMSVREWLCAYTHTLTYVALFHPCVCEFQPSFCVACNQNPNAYFYIDFRRKTGIDMREKEAKRKITYS